MTVTVALRPLADSDNSAPPEFAVGTAGTDVKGGVLVEIALYEPSRQIVIPLRHLQDALFAISICAPKHDE